MKIVKMEAFGVRVPLVPERHMITSLGQHTVSEYVLVRVLTDDGIEGAGEATVSPRWSGETVWGCLALIDRILAPAVIGCDPHNIAEIDSRMDKSCQMNWFAKSAIEMACWDIQGKAAGKPVYELLGGPHRHLTIRSRYSMGAYDVDRAKRRAAELIHEGFRTIKVKVGLDPKTDVERVRGVRETIGPEVDLMIDANCGWTADVAIDCLRQLADCRLTFVEQPTPDGDYAAMARVRRETGCKILADDICFDLVHAQELIRNECCDAISLYPGKNGGIRKACLIADYAEKHGIPCSIGSNLELDVGTAAMGHFVLGSRNMKVEDIPGDLLGPAYHEFSIVKNPLDIKGPLTTVPDRPGLGIEVDWDLVRKHPVP
ncbi:MAG: dipeptide epimerase [Gemmatales bacterium]|nr:MAG: dipeptide epimerase [Gemmatales bacterium]